MIFHVNHHHVLTLCQTHIPRMHFKHSWFQPLMWHLVLLFTQNPLMQRQNLLTHFNPYHLRGFWAKQVLYCDTVLSLSLLPCSNRQFVIIISLWDDFIVTVPDVVEGWCPICFTVEVHLLLHPEAGFGCAINTKLLNGRRVTWSCSINCKHTT